MNDRKPISHALWVILPGLTLMMAAATGIFPVYDILEHLGVLTKESSLIPRLIASQWWSGAVLTLSGILYIFFCRNTLGWDPSNLDASTRKLAVLAASSGLASLFIQSYLFQGIPHITDATSHVFQAKIMATGTLSAPIPPCYEAFFQHNVIIGRTGLWHTKYFPGQALWLTPGFILSAKWLMMPLGWSLSVFSLGILLKRYLTGVETLLATTLFAFSPLGLLLSGSFMSHTTLLMFMIGGLACYFNSTTPNRPGRARTLTIISGFLFGMAAVTRPQDGLPFFCGVVIAASTAPREVFVRIRRTFFSVLGGFAIPVAFLFFWNYTLYGNLFSSGYNFDSSPSLTPIISDSIGFGAAHTVQRALRHAALTLYRFENTVTGWPLTLPLAVLILCSRRTSRLDAACLGTCAGTMALYLFFHYWGFELEARYYAPMIPAVAVLLARSLFFVHLKLLERGMKLLTPALLTGFTVYTIGYTWAYALWPIYNADYEQASTKPLERAANLTAVREGRPVLILMESNAERDFVYSGGFNANDPFLENQVLFARYAPELVPCLQQAFPGRKLYVMEPYDFDLRELAPDDQTAGKRQLSH